MNRVFAATLLFIGCASLLSSGCGGGGGSSVSGTVTFNGQPVEKGLISFYSADGKGTPVGGPISGGKYTVKNVPVGKAKVEVTSQTAPKASDSMGDSVKEGKEGKKASSKDDILPTDEGNGQFHEIAAGSATLDLTLRTSSSMGTPSGAAGKK